MIRARTTLRSPLIIGKNCKVDAYVGPYSSISYNTLIREAELENALNSKLAHEYQNARRGDQDGCPILYSSTSEGYGAAQVIPTQEDYWGNVNPVGSRSCYDEGKRFGEALFMAYMREYGLDIRMSKLKIRSQPSQKSCPTLTCIPPVG